MSKANSYGAEILSATTTKAGKYGGRARVVWRDKNGNVHTANTSGGGSATFDALTHKGGKVNIIRNGRGTIVKIDKYKEF